MTVDCANIESILGPLRRFDFYDRQMISLRPSYPEPHERSAAWAAVKWTETSAPPLSEWLGNVDSLAPHDDVRERMRVAAFIAFTELVPVLADGHPWSLLDHQVAGIACRHVQFVGRRVQLEPETELGFRRIASYWYDQQVSWGLPSLETLMEYREQLQRLGLDCNSSNTYRHLTEGFYPVDLNQDVIDRLCLPPFPLDSLLGEPPPYGGLSDRAILAVIAPNSD